MLPMSRFDAADPARIAISVSDQEITFGRFHADVAAMAGWIRGQELNPEECVGIYLSHPYWNWVAHLAAIRLGLTHATVAPGYLDAMVEAATIRVLLGETAALGQTAGLRLLTISPGGLEPLAGQETPGAFPPAVELLDARARRLAFTTGTTGKPKAVRWTAEQIAWRLDQVRTTARMGASTCMLTMLGIETTGGFRYPLATWQAGGCVLLVDRIPEGRGLRIPVKPTSTLVLASPGQLRALLSWVPGNWPGREKRQVIIAGGRLPIAVRDEALKRACARVSMTYGATETGSVAGGDSGLLDRHPGAVGFVRDAATVQIVDESDTPQPAGRRGIVRTRTPCMAERYEGDHAGQQAASEGAFRDGWFYPGDEGMLFDDGCLAITGRTSEVLNVGGRKISVADVESSLSGLPGVSDLCALALRLELGDTLAIVVVCGNDVNPHVLADQIKAKMPLSIAFRLVCLDNIPRNAMGKVPRQALANRVASLLRSQT